MLDALDRSPALSVQIQVLGEQQDVLARGEYAWRWPDRQRLIQADGGVITEFRQQNGFAHSIEHHRKAYLEFPAPQQFLNPPSEDISLTLLHPRILLYLKANGRTLSNLTYAGKQSFGRDQFDHVALRSAQNPEESQVDIFIDPVGKIRRIHFDFDTQRGPVKLQQLLSSHELNPRTKKIPTEIEVGYVPDAMPIMHTVPGAGWEIHLGKAQNLSTGQEVNLDQLIKNKKAVILMTSPDCIPSSKGKLTWEAIRTIVDRQGAAFIEISLPSKTTPKSVTTQAYHSSNPSSSLNPSVTPFILVLDQNSLVVQGWAGFSEDQYERILETVRRSLGGD